MVAQILRRLVQSELDRNLNNNIKWKQNPPTDNNLPCSIKFTYVNNCVGTGAEASLSFVLEKMGFWVQKIGQSTGKSLDPGSTGIAGT